MKKLFLCLMPVFMSCGAQEIPKPPADQLFFPSGIVYDKSVDRLYVSNGNNNLAFAGATVVVLDQIKALDAEGMACKAAQKSGITPPPGCQVSPEGPPTLCIVGESGHCAANERRTPHILSDATKQIGSFPSDFAATPDGKRLFFAVRGDPSLSFLDTDGRQSGAAALTCETSNQGTGVLPRCTGKNVLLADAAGSPGEFGTIVPGFPSEVFSVAMDLNRQLAGPEKVNLLYVSHPRTGEVSLFRLTSDLTPSFQQARMVAAGVTQIAIQPQTGIAYIARRHSTAADGSMVRATVEMVSVQAMTTDPAKLELTAAGSLLPSGFDSSSTDYQALSFSSDGKQLYIGTGNPASVVILDTSLDLSGKPKNLVLKQLAVSSTPSEISTVPLPTGGATAYVTAFAGNLVHAIDPQRPEADTAAIPVGSGPHGMAFAELGTARRLFVASFNEDTLWVIDVDPKSSSFNQVLYRVGAPRLTNPA